MIVATETRSFTIEYEVLELDGAVYVSGPLTAEQFMAFIDRRATRPATRFNPAATAAPPRLVEFARYQTRLSGCSIASIPQTF
jgi:hypothetical protein